MKNEAGHIYVIPGTYVGSDVTGTTQNGKNTDQNGSCGLRARAGLKQRASKPSSQQYPNSSSGRGVQEQRLCMRTRLREFEMRLR